MEENELYIGKLYYQIEHKHSDNPFKKVIQFDPANWYRIGECIEFLEDFEPIPLTEDWLLKMAEEVVYHIKKSKEIRGENIKRITKGEPCLPIEYTNDVWFYRFGNYQVYYGTLFLKEKHFYLKQGDTIIKVLDYVHNFQNLIHALTNTELTIKL